MQTNLGDLNSIIEENIVGIRVVKAFVREKDTFEQFLDTNYRYRQAGTHANVITAALGPMFNTMNIFVITAVALLGGWLALQDIVQVGVIATFIIYISNFFQPMRAIAMLYNQLQSAFAGAERIFAVLDAEPTVQDVPDAPILPPIDGHVIFKCVNFEYEPDKPILNEVTLKLCPDKPSH